MGCKGDCGSCSGCGRELELTKEEINFLQELGQIPFLPVVRQAGEDTPVFPESPTREMSLVLQCLEKKGLISLDYCQSLAGFDYGDYEIKGSTALTARGQAVLELLEYQGFHE